MQEPLYFMNQEEDALHAIRSGKLVCVLLYTKDSVLSSRAMSIVSSNENRLYSSGCSVFYVHVKSDPSLEEFSCVRVPQLRFFVRGKLSCSITGVFDESSLYECIRNM